MPRNAALRSSLAAAFAAAVLTVAGPTRAQRAAEHLEPIAAALGLDRVAALTVVGSGSGYEPIPEDAREDYAAAVWVSSTKDDALYVPPPPPPTRRHYRVPRETHALDLTSQTLTIERERGEAVERRTVGPDAPWNERHRYWLTPHAFVRGALAGPAEVSTGEIDGKPHRVVTFTPEGGAEIRGFIDDGNRLVRLQTTIDDGGSIGVEASFLHWEPLGGIEFPTTWIRRENGELAGISIVREIDVRASR